MAHHSHCPHCRAFLPAPRSRLLGGSVLALAYVVSMAMVFGYSLLGPIGFMILPIFLPGAIGGITAAHAYANPEDSCPKCGKFVERKPVRVVAHPIGVVARA